MCILVAWYCCSDVKSLSEYACLGNFMSQCQLSGGYFIYAGAGSLV